MTKLSLPSFPSYGSKNIYLYYFLMLVVTPGFILPNWVFYFGIFISIPAIGLIDGVSKLFAVVIEIPSGAVSDLLGKRKTLILGLFMHILSCLTLIYASNFASLLFGNIIMFFGFALLSGSKEAILYDSLLEVKAEKNYDEVLGKSQSLSIVALIFSVLVGGFLYGLNPTLPFWAWLVSSILAVAILLFMHEPKVQVDAEQQQTFSQYLMLLRSGAQSIFQKSFPKFVLPVLFLAMLIKSYEGVVRQSTGAYFGFDGETFGYLMAAVSIPSLFVSYGYARIVKKLDFRIEYLFGAFFLCGFSIASITNNLSLGIGSFLSIYIAQGIAQPFVTSLINRNTESSHRATALSTVALLAEIPYIIVVIGLSFLLALDTISYLYMGLSIIVLLYLAVRFYQHRTIPQGSRIS